MGLAGADAHHGIADDALPLQRHPAQVRHPQAIVEDAFGPRKLVRGTLNADDLGHIRITHRTHDVDTGFSEVIWGRGHGWSLRQAVQTRRGRTSGPPRLCACPPACATDTPDDTSRSVGSSAFRTHVPGRACAPADYRFRAG